MQTTLPKEINYTKKSGLPSGTQCLSTVAAPQNGSTFSDSSLIIFQLASRGYLVPESMYLRYKITVNNGGTVYSNDVYQRGSFPAYTPFLRAETIIGSTTVESIANYHQLNEMLLTCKIDYGQKLGLAAVMGLGTTAGTAFNLSNMNAHTCVQAGAINTAGESWYNAIPINNILANAENLVPLKFMPATTIQFYTDTTANMFNGTTLPASYTLSNLELCYDIVEFNEETDVAVQSMADAEGKLTIKSQSYLSSGQTTSTVVSGSVEYIYSMRLASIKSVFLIQGGTWALSANKLFDSFDITSGNGDYQFFIAGTPYPSRPISTVLNRAGILSELGTAVGSSAQDISKYHFSINPVEFSPAECNNFSTTTSVLPAKFYVGTNVERLQTNSALLTGVSSQLSPISIRINVSTPSTAAEVLNLVANFDAILVIDIANRQCQVLI